MSILAPEERQQLAAFVRWYRDRDSTEPGCFELMTNDEILEQFFDEVQEDE